MIVGVKAWELQLAGCQSLKDKRRVIKSLKDRLHARFNVSVAEVDHQDSWQRAALAASVVSNDQRHAAEVLGAKLKFLGEGMPRPGEGVALGGADFRNRLDVPDPLAPRLDHRRQDALEDVGLRRVVRPERPLPLRAERSLEQRAEDRRLDARPVEGRGLAQERDLVGLEVEDRRRLEETAVRIGRSGVETVRRRPAGRREPAEELAELVRARAPRIRDQVVEAILERSPAQHPEVLGEHRPDALEDEVPHRVTVTVQPLLEAVVEVGDPDDRVARQGRLALERRVTADEERERLPVLG